MPAPAEPTGVYLIGACGAVATTAVVGASVVGRGLMPPTGLVTALRDFAPLELVPLSDLVFGGCEIRRTSPLEAARELCGPGGVLQPAHIDAARDTLEGLAGRLDPGLLTAPDDGVARLEARPLQLQAGTPRQAVSELRRRLEAFGEANGLRRVIVVNLASTEPLTPGLEARLATPADLEQALDQMPLKAFPPSVLGACAAIDAGCPYLNFTPSAGSSVGALIARAAESNVPHMGRDGKTGETLLKTTLAPMFVARHLRVLSWEGHNILGNRDGAVLDEPANVAAKLASKDEALRSILGDPRTHSRVRIDYVPSLADWKTAWDFIHFEGFLGTRMILQLIWQGCDSALAAPLVLDMVRLLDHADRTGRGGLQPHLAPFFKAPTGVDEHSFPAQVALLDAYVRDAAASRAEV